MNSSVFNRMSTLRIKSTLEELLNKIDGMLFKRMGISFVDQRNSRCDSNCTYKDYSNGTDELKPT